MPTITIKEAQTHLSRLIKLASEGETVVITNHGHPVAELVRPGKKAVAKTVFFGCIPQAAGLSDRLNDEREPINQEVASLLLGDAVGDSA
jgi:antitoxin (DNA-binding transcriptional repressor) of toxin-antitoxin stability system